MNDGFLSGLLNSFTSGARSSLDAFEQDFSRLQEGRKPDQAIRALQQILAAYDNPMGVVMPKVNMTERIFKDPKIGWEIINQGTIDPLQSLLMSGGQGSIREALLRTLLQQRQNMGAR